MKGRLDANALLFVRQFSAVIAPGQFGAGFYFHFFIIYFFLLLPGHAMTVVFCNRFSRALHEIVELRHSGREIERPPPLENCSFTAVGNALF